MRLGDAVHGVDSDCSAVGDNDLVAIDQSAGSIENITAVASTIVGGVHQSGSTLAQGQHAVQNNAVVTVDGAGGLVGAGQDQVAGGGSGPLNVPTTPVTWRPVSRADWSWARM